MKTSCFVKLCLLALVAVSNLQLLVQGYTSTVAFVSTTTRKLGKRETQTQLFWSLPAPLQNPFGQNKNWYQDIGCGVDKHVVYQEDDDWGEEALRLLGHASISLMEDDTLESKEDPSSPITKRRRFPVRMASGVWRRIRRNPRSTGVL